MKKIIGIALIVLLSVGVLTAADLGQSEDTIHAYIVLDCGRTDMETWEMLRARAIEVVCTLKAGDRMTVIISHPSGARLYLAGEISPDKTSVDAIVKKIATLNKDWVVRTDMSAATAFAYERMAMPEPVRQGCVVLTTGDMRDDEFAGMVHVASLFAARKVPLTLICEHTKANRQLLLSGIELHYLDKPAIAEWIGKVRPVIRIKTEPNLPKVLDSPKPVEGGKIRVDPKPKPTPSPSVIVSPPTTPQPKTGTDKAPDAKPGVVPDANSSKPSTVKPNPSEDFNKPAKLPVAPLTKKAESNDANKAKDKQKALAKADGNRPNDLPQSKAAWPLRWWILLAIAVLLVAAIVVIQSIGGRKPADDVAVQNAVPTVLVALVGKDRHELGSPSEIREIVIGGGLGSTVFVSGDGIAPQHCHITRGSKGFTLQNCSDAAITTNGLSVKPKGKALLDLPAELELTSDVHVVLVEEEYKS